MENEDLAKRNPADRPNDPYRPNEQEADEFDPVESADEVYQDQDAEGPTVPVCVKTPVRTQLLPATNGGSRKYSLVATEAVRILTADPRRRRAVMQATGDDNFVLAATQQEAMGPFAASFQSFTLLEVTACTELWARAESTTVDLSVLNEQWAE